MLNSRQRAFLRGLANSTDTIFQIGKNGVTDETCFQLSNALEARELIKIKVLETSPVPAKESADEIAGKIGADVVQVIGTKIVLYRQAEDNENRKISPTLPR